MRKVFNAGIKLIAVFMFVVTLAACSKDSKVSIGSYHADGDLAVVAVRENNEMMISGPEEVSAAFTGTYTVEGDKITLSIPNQKDHTFTVEKQSLVFESGDWLENWVEQGTVFSFSGQ